ncbi:MAG: replicative DNA helicase [Ignavibacteriae bacterium]|nr:replicative DNA helicase [Ignavibacteriota bacterium]
MAEPLRSLISAPASEGRVPPQAVEIEAQVLGAMLLEREAIARVIEVLDDDAFHADYHRKIFQAVLAMFDRSEPVDIITLAEELRRRGHLEVIGGETYLAELTMKVTSAANVEYHAKFVLEKSLMRNLITATSAIAARGFSPTEDAFDLLDEAEQTIFQISEKRLKKTFIAMHKAVHDTLEVLESIHGKHSGVTGVPSGFFKLDELTAGWQNSDLIIVAGRPSSGKTAFALSLTRNAAMHHEKPTGVGIFSLEMSTQQLVMRLLCAEAKVDAHAVRTGRLPEDDWKRLSLAAGRLAKTNIFIDDTASLGILELRAKARRLKAERNIGLVVVDYLQLMQGPKDAESREKEISAISRSLKALAKELNIPVIALSQLSRAVESRNDKRPILSDLRESGAIEQDADVVCFVHRPEMYMDAETRQSSEDAGQAEIIVGKQRNGPIDDVKLAFVNRYARFENLAPSGFEGGPPAAFDEETPF